MLRNISRLLGSNEDPRFLIGLHWIEQLVAKVLSIGMTIVTLVAVVDLGVVLIDQIRQPPDGYLGRTLIDLFGLFLNILIALEILENITAYLRKNVIQVELVVVTSIIAVARKIIILDFEKTTGLDIIGLSTAIFALSISYWIVRSAGNRS
jgi:uncharacterized membrane protein (DUF373 family)